MEPQMAPSQPQTADAHRSLSEKFYFAAWRWHFYAGLYVIPFMIMLAVTGLMMMFITQFDGRDGEKIAITPGDTVLSLSEQSQIATNAVPGTVVEWIGPKAADLATVFRIKTEAGQQMVALNQFTGEVVATWDRRAGWYDLADNIHSTLLIGDTGDRLIEIAAGLALVLVLTRALRLVAARQFRPCPGAQSARPGPRAVEIAARRDRFLDVGAVDRIPDLGPGLGRDLGRQIRAGLVDLSGGEMGQCSAVR